MEILLKKDDEKGKLEIILPSEFRNRIWSTQFGKIQTFLRKQNLLYETLTVDITHCSWIDPLPLLSLFISIAEVRPKIANIYIKIPTFSSLKENNRRVLVFLKLQGVFEEAANIKIKIIDTSNILINKENLYNKVEPFSDLLYYQDSVILPFQIIDLAKNKDSDDIVQFVEDKIKSCEHKLRNRIPNYSYKKTVSSLSVFLTESLTNIYEHAYTTLQTKYAGILVRYRIGMTDSSISSYQKIKLRKAINDEYLNSYRLSREFPESVSDFFEIFVIDSGIGLSKSFLGQDEFIKYRDPFHKAWEKTIGQGRRNPFSKAKTTKFGGLYIIGKLITESYLCARDEGEWIGEELPIKKESGTNETITTRETQISGLSLILRLSWKKSSQNFKNWTPSNEMYKWFDDFKFIQKHHPFHRGTSDKVDIYKKYYNKKYGDFRNGNILYIRDERFGDNRDELSILLDRILPKDYLENPNSQNFILYLPQPGQSKSQISTKIIEGFSLINNPSKTIIIADIPDHEAALYEYALADAKYDKVFFAEFDKIILVTRKLSVLILSKQQILNSDTFTFIEGKNTNNEYIDPNQNFSDFSPHLCLEQLVEWLKTHDSLIYWLNINNKPNRNDFFMNGDILWYKNMETATLRNFFTFSQTLSDEISLALYDIILNRAISLADSSGFNLIPMDSLTSRIANTVNSTNEGFSEEGVRIFLGSVYVTGVLEENSLYNNLEKDVKHHLIHFLYNPTISRSTVEIRSTMLFWPNENFLNLFNNSPVKNYRRVGQLSTIAPFGWKYYSIPRYNHKSSSLRNIPIHELEALEIEKGEIESNTVCMPYDTYRDWQNNEIVSIGHYEYSTYHDFFKINTIYAFQESWQLNSNLAFFLLSEIMSALGIQIENLKTKDNVLKGQLRKYIAENHINIKQKGNCPLVVFPNHYALDVIIQKIKTLLPGDFNDKIVSIGSISNNKSSIAFLPSPQIINLIRKEIAHFKDDNKSNYCSILFIDTVRINGNIEKQIKHILKLLGATEVNSVILLDRQLSPIHKAKSESDKIFWKLDLPVLGHKNSCPLCRGLERVDILKSLLVVDTFINRISEYEKTWGKLDRYSNAIEKHGIKKSQKVALRNKEKKYGIYIDTDGKSKQIGGDKNKIYLTSSIGLSIYCAELHAMTCRDNMILEILQTEEITEETKIELIASNLLIFNYQYPYFTLKELLKFLISTTKNISIANNHTALAAITLMACQNIPEDLILNCIIEEKELFVDVKNIDIIIFLCYCGASNLYTKIKKLPEINRCFKSYKDLQDLNKQFHQELYNDYGKAHNTPLYIITIQLKFSKHLFQQSYNSVCKLRYLIDEFDISDFRSLISIQELIGLKKEIDTEIERLKSFVTEYMSIEESVFDDNIESIRGNSQPIFLFLREKFIEIHENLFIRLDIEKEEFTLKDEVAKLISNVSSLDNFTWSIGISEQFIKPEIPFDSNIKERWVIWDKAILTEIGYIIRNCSHINMSDRMYDPDDSSAQITKKHMWVLTSYTLTHLQLNFINLSDNDSVEIQEISQTKFRYEIVRIQKLGGEIRYSNNEYITEETKSRKTVITTVSLPFI